MFTSRWTALVLIAALLAGCAGVGTALPTYPPLSLSANTSTPPSTSTMAPTPSDTLIPPPPRATFTPAASPTPLDPNNLPVMLAAGAGHTCLLSGGTVRCWGADQFGQLGAEADINTQMMGTPVMVQGLPSFVPGSPDAISRIASGLYHTCALTTKEVLCWGSNNAGQLGDRPEVKDFTFVPAAVKGVAPGMAIAAKGWHTCVIARDQTEVVCWGSYITGRPEGSEPVEPGLYPQTGFAGRVLTIATGYAFTCAMVNNGTPASPSPEGNIVQCWGAGVEAHAALSTSTQPETVTGLPGPVTFLAAGAYQACAVSNGEVWCWERGHEPVPAKPVQVQGLSSIAWSLAAGDSHVCALVEAGTPGETAVQCWGDNYFGQIRAEGEPNSMEPITQTVQNALGIAAGSSHTCAQQWDGGITCWGDGSSGQLGDGTVRWK